MLSSSFVVPDTAASGVEETTVVTTPRRDDDGRTTVIKTTERRRPDGSKVVIRETIVSPPPPSPGTATGEDTEEARRAIETTEVPPPAAAAVATRRRMTHPLPSASAGRKKKTKKEGEVDAPRPTNVPLAGDEDEGQLDPTASTVSESKGSASNIGTPSIAASIDSVEEDMAMGRLSFRRIAIGLLVVQALSAVVFSWHAWRIQNDSVTASLLYILHLLLAITTWKAAISYRENFVYFRLSILLGMMAGIAFLMPPTRVLAVIYFWICCACLLACCEVSGRSWHVIVPDQIQRNSIAGRSLEASFMSGLVVAFLLSQAISSIGSTSTQERSEAFKIIREESPAENEDYDSAVEIFEETWDTNKSFFAGVTLNMLLIYSFMLSNIAGLSLTDIANLKLTIAEGIASSLAVLMSLSALLFLGIGSSYSGGEITGLYLWILNLSYLSIQVFACIALVCSSLVTRRIAQGTHRYYAARQARASSESTNNQARESIPLMSEEV